MVGKVGIKVGWRCWKKLVGVIGKSWAKYRLESWGEVGRRGREKFGGEKGKSWLKR